jgi:hypothetical protein
MTQFATPNHVSAHLYDAIFGVAVYLILTPLPTPNQISRRRIIGMAVYLILTPLPTPNPPNQPSALSLPYAVIAAVSLLMWAFRLPATATSRALWVMVLIFAISHVAVIYLYQFPFAQHAAPHSSLAARMLGLFRIVVSGPGRTCPPINPPYV